MAVNHQCCRRVLDGTFRGHRCQKPVKVQVGDQWYCAVHDPEAVRQRRDKRDTKFDAEMAVKRKRWALESAAAEMLALLIESQISIGGDWRERRDAVIAKANGAEKG